mmetsp:Transcript_22938/g.35885  ORF Transcript_22938/g.35885 Transcript_22938/m.35885 type:complete len:165 (+) Transcript_22938:102-596(+)
MYNMPAMSLLRTLAAVLLLLAALAANLSTALTAEPTSTKWSLTPAANTAFLPRGGGAISFRNGKSTNTKEPVSNASGGTNEEEEQSVEEDTAEEISSDEAKSSDETPVSPFQKAYQEEVSEIKKSQQFLQMQQRRRELDKTWMDKGITAVIELFENIFRWEVID